ncbi:MAG: metallophosphoesterase [Alphaproteobacteria bacterium]
MTQNILVPALGAAVLLGIPAYVRLVRGRVFATWGFVILVLSMPGLLAAHRHLADWVAPFSRAAVDGAFAWGIAAAGLHLAALARARLRPRAFRWLVSIPGMATIAAGTLAGAWLLLVLPLRVAFSRTGFVPGLDAIAWLDLLPFAVAALSVATSLGAVEETVRFAVGADPDAPGPGAREMDTGAGSARPLRLDTGTPTGDAGSDAADGARDGGASDGDERPERAERARGSRRRETAPRLPRVPVERIRSRRRSRRPPPDRSTLRVAQITDPHLGPWQPVARLRKRIAALLDREPDLVLLTGDFLTMEGAGTPGALAEALSPLRGAPGRCFAIFGNHDHECPDEVRHAMAVNGVRLLVDEEAVVETRVGPVQIVGADFVGRGRRRHLRDLVARLPRRDGHLRLLLLHDPSAFAHLPPGEVDLALSGHTHGGQVGLVSVGLDWTVLRRSPFPDHGLFAHGPSRLYVHRGTGFYGFPLRIGVPGEHSVLELSPPRPRAA